MKRNPAFLADPAPAPKRSKKRNPHLDFIASLPCAVCVKPDAVPHHLLRVSGGTKGMGIKNPDRFVIPLCLTCHDALHRDGNETRYLNSHCIDGPALAALLWDKTRDADAARLAIVRRK